MSAEIRTATKADQANVLDLLQAQLGEHSIRPPDAALEFAVGRMLEAPERGRILVASLAGELVGVAVLTIGWSIEHGGASSWLDELYVRPSLRAGGIGTALFRAARAVAASEGLAAIDLEVEIGHERAANLYRREGFRPHQRARWMLELTRSSRSAAPGRAADTGGCLCGAVRYGVVAAPFDVSHCHCSLCRRSTGAPFVTWVTFPAAAFTLTAGTPKERKSSAAAVRTFCGDCGTALTFREEARPKSVDVTAGSLDHPEEVVPVDHTHTRSKLPWLRFADRLPRHEEANPDERDVE